MSKKGPNVFVTKVLEKTAKFEDVKVSDPCGAITPVSIHQRNGGATSYRRVCTSNVEQQV